MDRSHGIRDRRLRADPAEVGKVGRFFDPAQQRRGQGGLADAADAVVDLNHGAPGCAREKASAATCSSYR